MDEIPKTFKFIFNIGRFIKRGIAGLGNRLAHYLWVLLEYYSPPGSDRVMGFAFRYYHFFYKIVVFGVMGFLLIGLFFVLTPFSLDGVLETVSLPFFFVYFLVICLSFILRKLVEAEWRDKYCFEDYPDQGVDGVLHKIGLLKSGSAVYFDAESDVFIIMGFDREGELMPIDMYETNSGKNLRFLGKLFGWKEVDEDSQWVEYF